jgi:formate hydrogenlyase transcriptional activator
MADAAAHDPALVSRYDALLSVSRTLAGHKTTAELFEVLADHLHTVVPFDYLALLLHDAPTDEMRLVVLEPSDIVVPFRSRPVSDQGPGGRVWTTQKGEVVRIDDNDSLPPAMEFLRSQRYRVACFLPLTTAHGKLGVLSFGSCSETAYSDEILKFMEQVAAIVAIAVDNGINYDQAQRYELELRDERDSLRFLLGVNNLLISHLDYPSLLEAILDAVQPIVKADRVAVALRDEDSEHVRLDWIYDKVHGLGRSEAVLPMDRSIAGATLRRGAASLFRRTDLEANGSESAPLMKAAGLESVCCVPLTTRNGTLGALYVGSVAPDAFSEQDVRLLGQTSAQIAIAVENARAYQRIAQSNAQLIDEKEYLERELYREFADIVGSSPTLGRVLQAVKTVAPTDSTVLLLGETGTGKELIARAVHQHSPRSDRAFVRASVAALPAGLLESELFGHEKGAFTGASVSRAGRFELANRGTLFLDEVGDIPAEVQPKLLRVLQEREFERLGSTRTQRVDVRVVAATNRDLEHMVEEGVFRSDLYYRLNVFPIAIPPLRERVEDIPALAIHFTRQCARHLGRPVLSVPSTVMDALKKWSWPGNIRELQNVIERAVITSTGSTLVVPAQDIQPRSKRAASAPKPVPTFHEAERQAILQALRESNGVIAGPTGAAARLGLRRTTLQSKMRRLQIQRPSY